MSTPPTAKLQPTPSKSPDPAQTAKSSTTANATNTPALLEEDDEFEDFPIEDWTQEESEMPGGNTHLWEESWDDDDENEDFSKQLKQEMKKVEGSK